MMKHTLTVSLLTISGLFLSSGQLSAWERNAMEECKTEEEQCKQDAKNRSDEKQCKMDADECRKNASQADENSFVNALNSSAASQFQMFTPKQKKQAMDKADNNNMYPNDAVAKVYQDKNMSAK